MHRRAPVLPFLPSGSCPLSLSSTGRQYSIHRPYNTKTGKRQHRLNRAPNSSVIQTRKGSSRWRLHPCQQCWTKRYCRRCCFGSCGQKDRYKYAWRCPDSRQLPRHTHLSSKEQSSTIEEHNVPLVRIHLALGALPPRRRSGNPCPLALETGARPLSTRACRARAEREPGGD